MYLKTAQFRIIKILYYLLSASVFVHTVALFLDASDAVLYIIFAVQLLIGVPLAILIEKWIVAEGRRKEDTRKLAKMFWLKVLGVVIFIYALVSVRFFAEVTPGAQLFDIVYGFVLVSIFFVPSIAFGGAVLIMKRLDKVYKNEEEEFFRCLN